METVSARGRSFAAQQPTFRNVLSDSWDLQSNPNGIVNLGPAENTLSSLRYIDPDRRTYIDIRRRIQRIASAQECPRTALSSSDLVITSGFSNALECCAWALTDPGDYILVVRPYFNAFKTILGTRLGVELLEVAFAATDPFSMARVQQYEKAHVEAKSRGLAIKAFLLCSPHNPLGRCYPEEVLQEYMKFCARNGLHLISDEIYALSTRTNDRLPDAWGFKSILFLDVKDWMNPDMVHVVWGLSKDSGATGLRIECLISPSNTPFFEAAEGISLHNFPSSVADRIALSLLLDEEFSNQYISINRRRLATSYHFTTGFLRGHGIPYIECRAAFFIWMNLRAMVKEQGLKRTIRAIRVV